MALEKLAKIPSLVRKAGQSASKAQPFYSNVDQAIANITQGTGTGAQMLAELLKTKGVAKELKDRPAIKKTLEANKDSKVTKADLERLAAENPPPQLEELIKTKNTNNPYQIVPDADGFNIEISGQRLYPDPITLNEAENAVQSLREEDLARGAMDDTKHSKYTIPGGENYRELLIKLPSNRSQNYYSTHFNEPNILAHARVTDRVGPNGEKILHVEEIQSDWHQTARDVRKKKIKFLMEEKGIDEATARTMVPEGYGYKKEGIELQIEKSNKKLAELEARHRDLYRQLVNLPNSEKEKFAKLEAERNEIGEQIKGVKDEKNLLDDWRVNSVPDAPLKQNWHELVMKRLLDDAARNGYDKVVITPGAEQANRYSLSKHINNLKYDELGDLRAFDKEGRMVISQNVAPENLDEFVGEELADKLRLNREKRLEAKKSYRQAIKNDAPEEEVDALYKNYLSHPTEYSGLDLKVGGKGMIGFYDQILPSYLNDYGKRYGVQVGTYEMPVGEKMIPDRAGLGMIRSGEQEMAPFHSFDITPQMREDITTKGVPLYQAAPPVAIGAGAMQEEQPSEYAGGGAVRKALKAVLPKGQQAVLSAEESAENLQKFLGNSRIRDTLYHATPKSFSAFKPGGDDPTLSGPAIWLTPNAKSQPAAHNIGGGERGFKEGTNVMPVYAQARSPLLLDDRLAIEWARDVFAGGSREFPDLIHPKTVEELKKSGYDSIIHADPYGNRGGEQEIIMFEPNKIKSAIGNRGTYDITDPDINKAGGGIIKKAAKALLPRGQQAILPAAESAANLDKFLADSAIKDRLYHGTNNDFRKFSDKKLGQNTDTNATSESYAQTARVGHWFNTQPMGKSPEKYGAGYTVDMPVYLSIKNPKREMNLDWLAQGLESKKGRAYRRELEEQGYDGVVLPDEEFGGESWIAFQPTQIKSAIGNRGTYDITDPDINKAKGGRVTNDAMWMAVQNKQLRKKHGN